MESLGAYLKKRRNEKGYTLREVEDNTKISNAYLSQLENNRITKPSPKILKKLSETYEGNFARLMELAGHPTPDNGESLVFKTSQGLEDITKNEERELLDYLKFIRQRRNRK